MEGKIVWEWLSTITIKDIIIDGLALISAVWAYWSSKTLARDVEFYKKQLEKEYFIFQTKVTNLQEIYPILFSKTMPTRFMKAMIDHMTTKIKDTADQDILEFCLKLAREINDDYDTDYLQRQQLQSLLDKYALFLSSEVEKQFYNYEKKWAKIDQLQRDVFEFDFKNSKDNVPSFVEKLKTLKFEKDDLLKTREQLKYFLRKNLKMISNNKAR